MKCKVEQPVGFIPLNAEQDIKIMSDYFNKFDALYIRVNGFEDQLESIIQNLDYCTKQFYNYQEQELPEFRTLAFYRYQNSERYSSFKLWFLGEKITLKTTHECVDKAIEFLNATKSIESNIDDVHQLDIDIKIQGVIAFLTELKKENGLLDASTTIGQSLCENHINQFLLNENDRQLRAKVEALDRIFSNELYKHHSGKFYQLLVVANSTATKSDYPEFCTYMDITTKEVFARPLVEFLEKFKRVDIPIGQPI